MNLILTIISGLIVLNIVVLVHEYGHYRSAVKAGVYAPVFAIGFGKTIWTFYKNDHTSFELKMIPFGGYVRMASAYEDKEVEVPSGYKTLEEVSKLRQIWIIAAGATYNMIFALVLFFGIGLAFGHTTMVNKVAGFNTEYNAYKVMKVGDQVSEINGHKISGTEMLSLYVEKENKPIVKRGNKLITVNITAKKNPQQPSLYLLGITQEAKSLNTEYGIIAGAKHAYYSIVNLWDMQLKTFEMLFSGRAKVSDMSGPVGIIKTTGKVVVENKLNIKDRIASFLSWIAMISVAIGLANILLFILPVVDGGRIFLIILSAIFRKDLANTKVVNYLMTLCVVLMVIYFVYITFMDFIK